MATDPVHTFVNRFRHTFGTFTHWETSTILRKFVVDCVRMHDVTQETRLQCACRYWIAVILAVIKMLQIAEI